MCAQSQSPPASFEVATIKPSSPDHVGFQIFSPGPGRLTVLTGTVKDLVKVAFDIRESQIFGGPAWLATDTFDINAKSIEPLDYPHLRTLLRPLLAERFDMVYHKEARTLPIYSLARKDKDSPSRLKELPTAGRGVGTGRGKLNGRGATVATLSSVLSGILGRIVSDRTGLTGYYDFTLEWSPDDVPDGVGPSIFTAIQEQLGLKLEGSKGPVDVMVIDRLRKPSNN